MIVDRHTPVDLSGLIPELRLEMEPELRELDRLLSDDELFASVKADLSKRYPNSGRLGRHSTPVEVILRMLVVRRLYDWSYEQTEHNVSDSLVLRQFTRLYLEPVPDDTTLIRWAGLIGAETLERLNERTVELAKTLKVTRGRKLRMDGTVVETRIHHPTDSSLLSDGVRVVGRLLRRARAVVGTAAGELCRDRTRSVRRLARSIGETARRRGPEAEAARKDAYERLLKIVQASLRQAGKVREILGEEAAGLRAELERYEGLLKQVVSQTRKRVLEGENVPAAEKVVSIFEPHTSIIKRGKADKDTEYGRKVWLDEVEGGIVSAYRVLVGNPPDEAQLGPSLQRHRELFGKPPRMVAADRGVYSVDNERAAQDVGIKRVVLPKPGGKTKAKEVHERQSWFRQGMRFRAGVEGRISVLKRRGYLGRCRDKGEEGFNRWVGWGVLTANLSTIARAVAAN